MSQSPKRSIVRLILTILLLALAFWFGPKVIQAGYRFATPAAQLKTKSDRYQELDEKLGAGLDAQTFAAAGKEMDDIYFWAKMRGVALQEEPIPPTPSQAWREIFAYWGIVSGR